MAGDERAGILTTRRRYLAAALASAGLLSGCSKNSEPSTRESPTDPSSRTDTPARTRTGTTNTADADHTETPAETDTTPTDPVEPDRPALEEPFLADQLAIAHYMPGMLPHRDGEALWIDPAFYNPTGPTSNVGGASLHAAIPALRNRTAGEVPVGLSTREAVERELAAASRFGVDAFEFYYPWTGSTDVMQRYNDVIQAFFDVAADRDVDVRFTVAVSHPTTNDQAETIRSIGSTLSSLFSAVEPTDRWLWTPSGRTILGTWLPDGLALGNDQYQLPSNPEWLQVVATAYRDLESHLPTDVAWLYDLHFASDDPDDRAYVDAALSYFPAVHGWHTGCGDEAIWNYVASECERRDRYVAQDVVGDFATSKLYTGSLSAGPIYTGEQAASVCPEDVQRWDAWLGLSKHFRTGLERVGDREADGVYLSTWNDYGEGHHVAPEINHNFGFAQLLEHYLADWRGENGPSDVAIAFFKKYPADATPVPFDLGAYRAGSCGTPRDVIEVVTILDAPATLVVNDRNPLSVPAGIEATRVPMDPGHVEGVVKRGEAVVAEFTTPEAITETPFRRDRLTFAYSSNHDAVFADLYGGDADVLVSNQYATQALVDGPNYGRVGQDRDHTCEEGP